MGQFSTVFNHQLLYIYVFMLFDYLQPAFADQHDNADLLEKVGCGLKIQQVDMSGQRIVKQEELLDILDQVAQWDKPLKLNRFFMSAQNLGNEAREALRSEGSSLQTFESLMTIAHG